MINLANCYEKTSRYARAIIWYENALLINPLSDDAHYGISLCYFKDDNASKALHHI
jgi:tetratricopeptide (TPR) repeat protein